MSALRLLFHLVYKATIEAAHFCHPVSSFTEQNGARGLPDLAEL